MSTPQQSRGFHRTMSSPPEDTPPEPLSNDVGKKTKRRISMLPKIGGGSSKSPSKLSSSSKGRKRIPTLDRDNSAVAMGKLTNDPREEMMMNTDTVDNINSSGHKKRGKEKAGSRKGRDKGGDNRTNMMRDMQQNSKYY